MNSSFCYNNDMRMRKKKWVSPFLDNENVYTVENLLDFTTDKPIHIEIGMGMGDFICESAMLNPEIYYIGLERVDVCVARAVKKASENNLENFKVMLADANNIDELIKPKSIDVIYLHFSDPWPKKRQNKRRLTYQTFLKKYERILKDDGYLVFKTDNEGFYDDSLVYFSESNFKLIEESRNYNKPGEPMTAYQAKFVSEGKPIYYAKYSLK